MWWELSTELYMVNKGVENLTQEKTIEKQDRTIDRLFKQNLIKRFIITILFFYPTIELSRLIIIYPYWNGFDVRPLIELIFIWSCFITGIWLCTKRINYNYTV